MAESDRISINRAPVLTLWAAVVAERLGYDREASLTLGRAVAGLNAASKARTLGIVKHTEKSHPKQSPRAGAVPTVELLARAIPVARGRAGLRAIDRDGKPSDPDAVVRYLEGKFGDSLEPARRAMTALAASLPPRSLAERASALYESFRPAIPAGVAGWGARGVLDLGRVRALAGGGRGARVSS